MPYLLCVLGIVLIGLNIKSIIQSSKEDKTFNDVLKNAKENINDNDIALGEIRREFAETILELQKEIISLKENNKKVEQNYKENINSNENLEEEILNKKEKHDSLEEMNLDSMDNNEELEKVILDYDRNELEIDEKVFGNENYDDNIEKHEINKNDVEKELIFDDSDKIYNISNEQEYEPLKNDKNSKVNELLEKGFSIEEISEMLSIGKGEILLIKELLKNSKKD